MAENKWLYLWVVQGRYGSQYGWEDLTAEEDWREARKREQEYRDNEPGTALRVVHRREPNPAYTLKE